MSVNTTTGKLLLVVVPPLHPQVRQILTEKKKNYTAGKLKHGTSWVRRGWDRNTNKLFINKLLLYVER